MKSSGLNKVPVFGQSKVLCDKSLHSSSHLILTPILWGGTIIYHHFSDELKKTLSNLPSHTARNLQNQNFNLEKLFSRLFSRASAFNLNQQNMPFDTYNTWEASMVAIISLLQFYMETKIAKR